MLAALLIVLGRLSLYILTSVGLYFPGQVTGEKHLLHKGNSWGDPGPDSSKLPPRNASRMPSSEPSSYQDHCREPQVPTPSPRTPPPPTGPPVTLLPSYPPPSGSLQLPPLTSHLPPGAQPAHSPSGYLCTALRQPLPDQGLTSSPLPTQGGGCRLLEQERTESQR